MHSPQQNRLLLFVDTEFTDFKDMDLVSIGIVSQEQHEFYAENSEYNHAWCNDFVKTDVLPKLYGGEYALPYTQLKETLQLWLSDLLEEYATVLFIFDYSYDWFFAGGIAVRLPAAGEGEGTAR